MKKMGQLEMFLKINKWEGSNIFVITSVITAGRMKDFLKIDTRVYGIPIIFET